MKFFMWLKVLVLLAVSTTANAHEVNPTVADLTISDGEVTLELGGNFESFLAGIDLSTVENTDDAANAADYDALRALSVEAFETRVREQFDTVARNILVELGGETGVLTLNSVEVQDLSDLELPRLTQVSATIANPENAPVQVGLSQNYGQLILRQQGAGENGFAGLLGAGEMSPILTAAGGQSEGAWDTFVRYIPVGIEHIVPLGLDHILFVLGLFFLTARLKPLLWQVSAFTLAHTVTLALGATGAVTVNPSIVEPLIALSIVYVAVENIFTDGLSRWRPALIFAFGLLHGLGFSTVLGVYGIPEGQFLPALIGFNIGVELGQLIVIAVAFALVGYWFRDKTWYRPVIAIPASLGIAIIGAYWVLERTVL